MLSRQRPARDPWGCEPFQNTQRQRQGPAHGRAPRAWAAMLEDWKALRQELMVKRLSGVTWQSRDLPALFLHLKNCP